MDSSRRRSHRDSDDDEDGIRADERSTKRSRNETDEPDTSCISAVSYSGKGKTYGSLMNEFALKVMFQPPEYQEFQDDVTNFFTCIVKFNGKECGKASARNKKLAKQMACEVTLRRLVPSLVQRVNIPTELYESDDRIMPTKEDVQRGGLEVKRDVGSKVEDEIDVSQITTISALLEAFVTRTLGPNKIQYLSTKHKQSIEGREVVKYIVTVKVDNTVYGHNMEASLPAQAKELAAEDAIQHLAPRLYRKMMGEDFTKKTLKEYQALPADEKNSILFQFDIAEGFAHLPPLEALKAFADRSYPNQLEIKVVSTINERNEQQEFQVSIKLAHYTVTEKSSDEKHYKDIAALKILKKFFPEATTYYQLLLHLRGQGAGPVVNPEDMRIVYEDSDGIQTFKTELERYLTQEFRDEMKNLAQRDRWPFDDEDGEYVPLSSEDIKKEKEKIEAEMVARLEKEKKEKEAEPPSRRVEIIAVPDY